MFKQEVNLIALDAALTALYGAQDHALVAKLYFMAEKALKDGYDLGKAEAEQNVEERLDEAFDNGWDFGMHDASHDIDTRLAEADDNGYIQGVADARARPATADTNVAGIVAYQAEQAYDAAMAQDSGDEQPEIFAERGYSIP
jgi:hypothetical protein